MKSKTCYSFLAVMLMVVFSLWTSSCSDDDKTIFGTCNISGTITDIDGAPIEGAKISVAAVGAVCLPGEATTDSNGHYSMKLTEATNSLVVMIESQGYYNYNEVVEGIPFKNPLPDETLGTATITLDFQLAAKPE